jgi:CO dehydrogenase maturation factor
MIIGFMGKGGSGKTTMSTLFTRHLVAQQRDVLAIDADHNMDLLYNLAGEQTEFSYLGEAGKEFATTIDLQEKETYQKRLTREPLPTFSFSPTDSFTERYTRPLSDRLRIMVAGPHTEEVRYGGACSHILAAPLKVYLPLLEMREEQDVVVDSTAGMDMVGTGIACGMDVVCICTEPTVHSTKTAKQIAEGLAWYGVPCFFVGTKMQTEEQRVQAQQWLNGQLELSVPFFASEQASEVQVALKAIHERAKQLLGNQPPATPRERAINQAKAGVDFFANNR